MKKIQILTSLIVISGAVLLSACNEPGKPTGVTMGGDVGKTGSTLSPQIVEYACHKGNEIGRNVHVKITVGRNPLDDAKKAFCYGKDASCIGLTRCYK